MFCKVLYIFYLLNLYSIVQPNEKIDSYINNAIFDYKHKWIVSNKNNTIKFYGTVPGGIYSDLMKENVIDDIFKDYNDVETRWVAKDEWIYTLIYEVSDQSILQRKNIYLTLFGVDTVAEIFLNGTKVDETDNMFVRYRYDIKNLLLKDYVLNITVKFKSPILESNIKFEIELNRTGVPVRPLCVPSVYNGECHVNHLRKQQASFGWDWGPAFPNVGLWKDVVIEAFDSALIRNIKFSTLPSSGISYNIPNLVWTTNITVYLEGTPTYPIRGIYHLKLFDKNSKLIWTNLTNQMECLFNQFGECSFMKQVTIDANIRPWWPNELGEQTLYTLEIDIISGNELSKKSINVGFRTIELVQNEIGSEGGGRLFFFKVNGVPVFMKGSNWLPSHILPEISDTPNGRKMIYNLLRSAKIAHMNMLRVWGGGVYESDYFYDLADKFGILIWQDFMFACSMYPANDQFLKSVKTEITQQVLRLQHHPSIALWAGNNENEEALVADWYQTSGHFEHYKKDYIKLYVGVIKNLMQTLDSSRPFVVSSPSNGIKSEEDGFVSKMPSSSLYGDVHYYNYFLNTWLEETFPIPRFASEYGVQSLPQFETWLEASSNPDIDMIYGDEFLKHRQHSPLGYFPINFPIDVQFNKNLSNSSVENLKRYIYLSQINQAMSIKIETEKYRRYRNLINEKNEGGTMGALYWQLNDVWQAPSWSGIDVAGRWKMLHYFAKDFFSPILASGSLINKPYVEVYVISDLIADISDVILTISLYKWSNMEPIFTKNILINVTKNVALVKYRTNLDNFLILNNCTVHDSFLYFSLSKNVPWVSSEQDNKQLNTKTRTLGPSNYLFLSTLKYAQGLKVPELKATVLPNQNKLANDFDIVVTTTEVSLFVWLTTNFTGFFSDNGFLMVDKERTIKFYSDSLLSTINLQSSIAITSLNS